ncbi:BCCT family transporter [Aureibacter tunicatorum]|uniref:Choline/glycine/proline betaine transport protein n=1 Tax=Aureibacter tunicatorum TaxID=866807 RepID=A0AAE3XPK1_9BACT|nr:BCCT family transporter [Aureibacter tunicatorum]MDR6240247.1 choline/glycine/proline betaine transport protein [Aureibacter tunicatorum]BDD05872.1 hypothetical protein AUTU_33550 [Aureibacter tunicatorum]
MRKNIKRSDKKTFFGLKVNGPVFVSSIAIILILVILTLFLGKPIEEWFAKIQGTISNFVGWFYILLLNAVLFFSLYLGFGKYSKIRLGGQEAKPDFTYKAWLAMLFSAGMGIGLLFWSVAEPIYHFKENPFMGKFGGQVAAAKLSMAITFMHWGVHPWALYSVVGLALAFFSFNRKLPLTVRSVFYPVLGKRIYGPLGDSIDTVSVLATIFGLATSLGLGVKQVNAGLSYLFDINNNEIVQVVLIFFITGLATLSLVLGLDKGIRVLSEWNMRIALVLLCFIVIIGPSLFIFKSFVQNLGFYIQNFFNMSFWTNSYAGIQSEDHWQNSWTIFYWSWWISWSPFVGIFIARISRGRTVKEFVSGVLLIPTLFTFFWMTAFGGSALYHELMGNHEISNAALADVSTAIYHLLEQYPYSVISSLITIILVGSFFVTSSDSGSFVVDMLTSGGRDDSPKGQKIFWASTQGCVAATLLIGGGLTALQTASIITAFPFALVIMIMGYSLLKSFNEYVDKHKNDKSTD